MLTRYAKFAWGVLAFNLAVILWGAVVRATGSGAGCGSNWPDCDGAIVPVLEDGATAIEFTHRLTSGLAFLAVIALFVGARRRYDRDHRVRRAAKVALGFMIVEVLIGAALVLFGWVDDDTSTARVVAIAVYLAIFFLLIGSIAFTAWWASGRPGVRLDDRRTALMIGTGLAALLVVGGIGAVTALGDTLFPEATLADDFRRSSHYLVQLRTIHPVLAIVASGYLLFLGQQWTMRRDRPEVSMFAGAVVALVLIQVLFGFVNLALAAPLWAQLVHLLLADSLWLATVLFGATALAAPVPAEEVPV